MDNLKKYIPTLGQKNNPFLAIQNELDRAIHEFRGWFEPTSFPRERFEDLALTPAIDIVDDKNEFKVEVEMPGMSEEDIKLSVEDNVLVIEGEKTTSTKDTDKNYKRREISYGRCERRVMLPDFVDVDKAKASFKKGMLWVQFPKKAESVKKSRTLSIEKA